MALNEEREEGTDFLTGIRPSAFGWRVNRTYLQKNKQTNSVFMLLNIYFPRRQLE